MAFGWGLMVVVGWLPLCPLVKAIDRSIRFDTQMTLMLKAIEIEVEGDSKDR